MIESVTYQSHKEGSDREEKDEAHDNDCKEVFKKMALMIGLQNNR